MRPKGYGGGGGDRSDDVRRSVPADLRKRVPPVELLMKTTADRTDMLLSGETPDIAMRGSVRSACDRPSFDETEAAEDVRTDARSAAFAQVRPSIAATVDLFFRRVNVSCA